MTQQSGTVTKPEENPLAREKLYEAEKAFRRRDFSNAGRICQEVLTIQDNHPGAMNILALICIETGQVQQALNILQHASARHPENAGIWANLGRLYLKLNKVIKAAGAYQKAVKFNPENQKYMIGFVQAMRHFQFTAFNQDYKDTLVQVLRNPYLTHSMLTNAWRSLFETDPAFENLKKLLVITDYESFKEHMDFDKVKQELSDPFMISGLKRLLLRYVDFETMLTHMRRFLSEQETQQLAEISDFITTLARYCFVNEYVFYVDGSESRRIKTFIKNLPEHPANSPEHKILISLIGCYRPLYTLPQSEHIRKLAAPEGTDHDEFFRELVQIQIDEPLAEQAIKKDIPALTPIDDEVSNAVRQMYEENPYPRWSHVSVMVVPETVKELARGKKILIAGCGTGKESADCAAHFPYADITAVDLSLSSLAYAIRKSGELEIGNVRYGQADILALDHIDDTFDLIISSGVLHHMQNPASGLRALLRRLKPNGIAKIALYSTKARAHFVHCQNVIKAQKIDAAPESIRSFRKTVMDAKASDPIKRVLSTSDFFSMSSCRDLLFHVQEHTYTALQISDLLEQEGLVLIRMGLRNSMMEIEFKKMFPDDPAMIDLANWDKFEDRHPATFVSMYNLWLCRKDEYDSRDEEWILKTLHAL